MFDVGKCYTRDEIHNVIRGNKQSCLISLDGECVGVCYLPDMNPEGPELIFVGKGPQKERNALILAEQSASVPVFVKRYKNAWEYLGHYRCKGYVSPPLGYEQLIKDRVLHEVAGVLKLTRAQ